MFPIIILAAYLAGAACLVTLALRAKNHALSSRLRSMEDDEQMRAITGRASRDNERDPLATAH